MRSVKTERKPRAPARQDGTRRNAAASHAMPRVSKPFGRRTKPPGLLARLLQATAGNALIFRRPMLLMTLGIIVLTLLAGLLASGVVGRTIHRTNTAVSAVVADAGFGISKMHLAGNRRTAQVTIMAALGFKPGQSIFGADLRAARARLLGLPGWRIGGGEAPLSRRYQRPHRGETALRPLAGGQTGNMWWNAPAASSPTRISSHFQHLPLLVGDGAPAAAAPFVDAVAPASRHCGPRHRPISISLERRWNLLLNDGVVVKLPESGWQKQLDALDHLIVDKGILERRYDAKSICGRRRIISSSARPARTRRPEAGSAI